MQEESHEKYAIDDLVNRLRAFQMEIRGVKETFTQNPGLLPDLSGVEDSISEVLYSVEQDSIRSIDDFDAFIEEKREGFDM